VSEILLEGSCVKVKVEYAECRVQLIGLQMNCPLCGLLVKDGEEHMCRKELAPAKKKGKKAA